MRIAIICREGGKTLAQHGEECFELAIYDVDQGKSEFIEIRKKRAGALSMGLCHEVDGSPSMPQAHPSLLEILADCDVFISREIEKPLVHELQSYGIKVFYSSEESVRKTAQLFAENRLAFM